MALPTLVKTWQFNANNAIAALGSAANDNRRMWRSIKDALIGFPTNPWTVRYSCGGGVAGSAGDGVDRWTVDTNIVAGNEGASHSWIVLRQTGIATNYEICISINTANANVAVLSIYVSPSAGFTGGSTTATPTATDQVTLFTNGGYGLSSDLAARWSAMQSTDGQCTRVWTANSGNIGFVWAFEKPANPTTGWSNPSVAFATTAAPGLLSTGVFKHGSLSGTMAMGVESIAVTTIANEISGEWPMVPIGLNSSTVGARGRQGSLQDMWWGSANVASGDTYPNDASNQFVQIGNLILPWNGGGVNLT
jgi:hypothetical protein